MVTERHSSNALQSVDKISNARRDLALAQVEYEAYASTVSSKIASNNSYISELRRQNDQLRKDIAVKVQIIPLQIRAVKIAPFPDIQNIVKPSKFAVASP